MNTYHFNFNNSKKSATILGWFFTTLLTIALTATVLLVHSDPFFPTWLLLISLPLMFVAIYRLFKASSERQSREIVSLSKDGFISSRFGSVLFSEIQSILVPVKEIGLLGGLQLEYYKKTDADIPYLKFSITTRDGKMFNWILNEWGGLYNSNEDFSIFFNFLTGLTDKLYQLYHADEPYNRYLKILDEKGSWEKRD
ncbi:hypothetical protein [Pedobacter nyackensis]|uniref:hypothetical protein n=1 Tax=Pedobacter nyackensis TaxID=475255 RepID=UPI00292E81D6|nr:hypothetical protein [Pedobacter nyackensis]